MEENFVNNSGEGKGIDIPHEVKRFSWGAFFFGWIWGLFNKSYLTLIGLAVPVLTFVIALILGIFAGLVNEKEIAALIFVFIFFLNAISNIANLALSVWFGIKGNDWAWQNKKWDSLKHFHDVQRIWATAGILLIGVGITGVIAAMTLPSIIINTNNVQNKVMIKKSLSTLQQATFMNETMEIKCKDLSSNGLASCFEKNLVGSANGNRFELADGNILEFSGNNHCSDIDKCYVKIITTKNAEEKISLYLDKKGYIKVDADDAKRIVDKYSTHK